MKKLTKIAALKIVDEWLSAIEDKNDKSLNGINFKIHPVAGHKSSISYDSRILDVQINEYSDLYMNYKSEYKALMNKMVVCDISLNSINSLLAKKTITGESLCAPELFVDLARVAFKNQFRNQDLLITESQKVEIIKEVRERFEDYLTALRKIDSFIGSSQAKLQLKFYEGKTAHVLGLWEDKKKIVSRTSNKNSRRRDMFGSYAIYFYEKFGTPLWSDVLNITSAFYDCEDSTPDIIRLTLSKKLGLTRIKA